MFSFTRTLLAGALLAASTAPALAEQFYKQTYGKWTVLGYTQVNQLNPACHIGTGYPDGSHWSFIRDLADGEVYMVINNEDWSFAKRTVGKEFKANVVYVGRRGAREVVSFNFEILGPTAIRSRHIRTSVALTPFIQFAEMHLLMPGRNPVNLSASLEGTSDALNALSECVDLSKKVDLYPKSPTDDMESTRPERRRIPSNI
jgi:hypothetical protein